MKQKTPQEVTAQGRQAELLANALRGASEDGHWMNVRGRLLPKVYPKGAALSPYNALILCLHADANGYDTGMYTTFAKVRAAKQAVMKGQTAVPINWYKWDTYALRSDESKTITKDEYNALTPEQQRSYRVVRQREIMSMFNLQQTTMPLQDAQEFDRLRQQYGGINDRGNLAKEDKSMRIAVNNFMLNVRENLVPIRKATDGEAHYDAEKDAVYMPEQKKYDSYTDYVQDLMRQTVSATGHNERLSRIGVPMAGGKPVEADAASYERLVCELASAYKMMELGQPAKLSPESKALVEQWAEQLKDNPQMLDALEADVNTAVEVIRKAEKGEKVEFASKKNADQTAELQTSRQPQVSHTEALIIQDILRHGGMKIDERNFPGATPEEQRENKKAFMEKFCNLDYYEGQLNLALWQAQQNQTEPELIDVAYTVAGNEADRIHRVMSEYLPKDWEQLGSHNIADEMMCIPDRKSKEFMVIKDPVTGIVDVVLPEMARSGGDVVTSSGEKRNYWTTPDEVMRPDERKSTGAKVASHNIPGFNKDKITAALMAQGATYVRFFEKEGELRYRPDDAYFKGKEVMSAKLSGKDLVETARFDVGEYVRRATEIQFDRVQMLKDDNGAWALLMKPENESSFCVHADRDDVNRFFAVIKQGNTDASVAVRQELANKYYAMAQANPDLKVDLFTSIPDDVDPTRIQNVTIFRTKDERIMCVPVITGIDKVAPRQITSEQWRRLWLADDVKEYKTALAANVFADLIRQEKQDVEQTQVVNNEASVVAEPEHKMTYNADEQDSEVDKSANKDTEVKETEDKSENADKEQSEEAGKEKNESTDKVKAEKLYLTAALLQQYKELKYKHPDAVLLFRVDDSYLALKDDAVKSHDILKLGWKNETVDGQREKFVMFPHQALDTYLPKLVRAGERIAICENMSPAKSKKQEVVEQVENRGMRR